MKKGDITRKRILDTGILFARGGLHLVTARAVSIQLHITHTAVFYYFPSIAALRNAIAEHALETKNAEIIARLIVDKHPIVDRLSRAERAKYLATF